MKRSVFLVSIFIFILFASFVSADPLPSVNQVINDVIQALKDILGPIFAALFGTSEFDDFLFTKMLLFLLLGIVVFGALKSVEFFERTRGLALIVSVIVSILAVRYISEDGLIAGILLPYGTLGIAITTFLPFLVYFWFVHKSVQGGFARKAAWILYGVVFVMVWLSRPAGEISSTSHWIYVVGFVAMFVSALFDGIFHSYFGQGELNLFRRRALDRVIANLQAEYLNIAHINSAQARRRMTEIELELRRLGARLP